MTDHEGSVSPTMDFRHRFDDGGRPKRPLDDLMTAQYMLARGFGEDDVRHVLGYLPEGWDATGMPELETPPSHG